MRLRYEDPLDFIETISKKNKPEVIHTCKDLILFTYPQSKKDKLTISTVDYSELTPGRWLSNNVVDFYVKYLEENCTVDILRKVGFLSSLFYFSLEREARKPATERNYQILSGWTREMRLGRRGSPTIIIVPVVRHSHWVALVAVLQFNLIVVLDSLGNQDGEPREAVLFRNFLADELNVEGHNLDILKPPLPLQPNGCDCALL